MTQRAGAKVSSRWVRWPEAMLSLVEATCIVFWLPGGVMAGMLRRHAAEAPPAARPQDVREAAAVAATVRRLSAKLPRPPRCLTRAVCVHLMLRRRGIAHTVHFGVRKKDGGVEAHAWVSSGGRALIGGRESAGLQPIASYGGNPT